MLVLDEVSRRAIILSILYWSSVSLILRVGEYRAGVGRGAAYFRGGPGGGRNYRGDGGW